MIVSGFFVKETTTASLNNYITRGFDVSLNQIFFADSKLFSKSFNDIWCICVTQEASLCFASRDKS